MSPPPRQRRILVPVDLGGSPTPCLVRPPLRKPPDPATVAALVESYRRDRAPPGGLPIEVAFFHGGLPDPALVAAAGSHPLRLSCPPGDLSRSQVEDLVRAGLHTVEVEALTFDEGVLRDCRRGYGARQARALLRGLKELGLRVGLVLAPGLPGGSHEQALRDAAVAAGQEDPTLRVDFVRVLPALAWQGSGLAARAAAGRWRPMRLGEAVTTCSAMVDLLEAAGVPVARVGLQPGADLPGTVAAGPVHPDLRGLVQARRFRARMERALGAPPPGARLALQVHPQDLSWAKGPANANVRALRAALGLSELRLVPDPAQARGSVARASVARGPVDLTST